MPSFEADAVSEPITPEEHAARFVLAEADGHAPLIDEWLAQLASDEERASFRQFVDDARMVQSLLPRSIGPGSMLADRYSVEHEIGSGGMGRVYRALDTQLGRPVAVKILTVTQGSSYDPLELFQRESRLLASLRHPNIVAIHEAGTEGDTAYLVMELVTGRSLADVIDHVREGASPATGASFVDALGVAEDVERASRLTEKSWWATVTRVMIELTKTLEATHAMGVVHRDLKPRNIVVRHDGTPVVLDFGLAGFLGGGDGAVTRGLVGSAAYLAPEQVQRRAVGADPRTDVYQLGLLMYELLTLERAYPEEHVTRVLAAISRGQFLRPRERDDTTPVELEAICLKAMELTPALRYQTAGALVEDLERYLEGKEVPHAMRGGTVGALARRARYFVRRHRERLVVGAATVAIGLAWWVAFHVFGGGADSRSLDAFRYEAGTWKPIAAAHGDSVRSDETIGVLVDVEEPVFLYVLSVFGGSDPPDWIAPMEPQAVAPPHETDEQWSLVASTTDHWALRVQPREGGTHVACARIGSPSPEIPYEGLWVIVASEPQPELARWMSALQRESIDSLDETGGVAYHKAKELLTARVRGRSPSMSSEDRARLLSHLDEGVGFDDNWSFGDTERFEFFFRVEQPSSSDG